ncbi:MAG: hypothetical protein ABI221_00855 [Candidatus Saccharimonadales bacterium]
MEIATRLYATHCLDRQIEVAKLAGRLSYPVEVQTIGLLQRLPGKSVIPAELWEKLPQTVTDGIEIATASYNSNGRIVLDRDRLFSNVLAHAGVYCQAVQDRFGNDPQYELPDHHPELTLAEWITEQPSDSALAALSVDLPSPSATRNFIAEWEPGASVVLSPPLG